MCQSYEHIRDDNEKRYMMMYDNIYTMIALEKCLTCAKLSLQIPGLAWSWKYPRFCMTNVSVWITSEPDDEEDDDVDDDDEDDEDDEDSLVSVNCSPLGGMPP